MDYPFKRIKHCIYNNTFLQNTIIEFEFDDMYKAHSSIEVAEQFNSFVKHSFGVEISETEPNLTNKQIVISSKDHAIKYIFGNKKLQLRIGRTFYKSFEESVIPNFTKIEDFFDNVLQNHMFRHASLRKINLLPLQNVPSGISLKNVLYKIFSKDLLSELNSDTINDDINNLVKWEKERNFKWQEYDIILRYGLKNQQTDDNDCILLLDIEVKNSTVSSIKNIPLEEYNNIIFDAYHWAINPDLLQFMNRQE